jgi:hypothetical protein
MQPHPITNYYILASCTSSQPRNLVVQKLHAFTNVNYRIVSGIQSASNSTLSGLILPDNTPVSDDQGSILHQEGPAAAKSSVVGDSAAPRDGHSRIHDHR